jgi:hypothetical protein
MVERTSVTGDAGRRCELCGRYVRRITRHHLVPRSRAKKIKRRKKRRRQVDPEELERTVGLCGPCHRNLHAALSNEELERGYASLEALRAHPRVRRFVEWVRTRPHGVS